MNGIQNEQSISVPAERTIASVTAWPDEVQVTIEAPDGNLTVEQARDLAAKLTAAAEQAGRLDWSDDEDNPQLVERAA